MMRQIQVNQGGYQRSCGQTAAVKHITTVHLVEKQLVSGGSEGVKHTMHTNEMYIADEECAKFRKDGKW